MSAAADEETDFTSLVEEALARVQTGQTNLSVQTVHDADRLYIEMALGKTSRKYVPDRIVSALLRLIKELPEARRIVIYTHAEEGPTPIRTELAEDDIKEVIEMDDEAALRFHILEAFEAERVI
jgi:uncharacterized protein (UPF0128 family)